MTLQVLDLGKAGQARNQDGGRKDLQQKINNPGKSMKTMCVGIKQQ